MWDRPAAFLLVVGASGLLIHILSYLFLKRLPRDIHRRRINRVLGTLPGFVSGVITAAILAALLLVVPLPDNIRTRAQESELVNQLGAATGRFEDALAPVFHEAVAQTLNKLMIRPESDQLVKLPYTVSDSRPRPDLEAQMLELVNRERAANGLAPLAPDPELTQVARRHSTDMFQRGYFSHYTPEGRNPFERIRAGGVSYLTAGENLALAPTLVIAHTGLMNSPGHRANILKTQFGRVGIGVMDGGLRGLMVTQNFRN
ncbi:MAG: CAP domain-containing protein [Pyrinomonadaceae bacterium]